MTRGDNPIPILLLSSVLLGFFGTMLGKAVKDWQHWDGTPIAITLEDRALEQQVGELVTLAGARCGTFIRTGRREPFNGGAQWVVDRAEKVAAAIPCRCTGATLTGCTGLLRWLEEDEVSFLRQRGYVHPKPRFGICTGCDRETSLAFGITGLMFCVVALAASAHAIYRYLRPRSASRSAARSSVGPRSSMP